MAAHIVKCKYCGLRFDANKEKAVKVSTNRYAHKECSDKYLSSKSQEELDYIELEKYIKKLFKKNVMTARIKKQIETFKEEYHYTYSGIQKTLYWWFELKQNSLDKANNGIGIVPYVYQDAHDYFYRLYLAEMANNLIPNKIPKPRVKEVTIESPRVYVASPKLFKFGEDSDTNE